MKDGAAAKPRTCCWQLTHACNYRCPYCFFIPDWREKLAETNARHLKCSEGDWLGFWRRIRSLYGEYRISVLGGEPFSLPNLLPLLGEICRLHRVEILTNLSWKPEEALHRLDPDRVSFEASFHPHFARIEPFLEQIVRIRDSGFQTRASVVAYPDFFEDLAGFRTDFEKASIPLSFRPFRGAFNGRKYPANYTKQQREWLRENSPDPGTFLAEMELLNPRGRECAAGQLYFSAWPNGDVYRCNTLSGEQAPVVGSIRDRDFRLLPACSPCPARACACPAEYPYLIDTGAPR